MFAFLVFAAFTAFAAAKGKRKNKEEKPILVPAGSGSGDTTRMGKILRMIEPTVRSEVRRHSKAKMQRRNKRAGDRLLNMALLTHLGYDASPFLNKRASSHIIANILAKLY